ncbi:MAG: YfhO family protein [Melioribacteraceae bacterium]|nr:YfhO family protein [Melioribacteraceae bacterium]
MARKEKKSVKKESISDKNILDELNPKFRKVIVTLLILAPILYFFSSYVFQGLEPIGTDSIGSKGSTNLYTQWQSETGEKALWNNNIFGGMPIYPRIAPQSLHLDTLISKLGGIVYWAFWYMLAGVLGIYFLLIYKKIPWYLAVISAIAFSLLPDWQALIGDGHYAKFRAMMIFPWLILSFNYFFDKKTWLGVGFFGLIFSWLVRTQHFQVVFYGILILLFLFIWPFIKMILDKEYKTVGNLLAKFVVVIILTVMTSAQPFLTIKEYTPHSTRGGNPVHIGAEENSAKESGGVSFEYATRWSLAPAEIMDFFIPRFHGGISNEVYDGKKLSHLKGREVPGYWGEKPFSGNYAYLGMLMFLFAVLGVIHNKKNSFVLALGIFTVFSVFLAFGRHLPELYKLFFYYVPYFAKFRAPAMFANISFISTILLAGFGLKALILESDKLDKKMVLGLFGGAAAFILVIYLAKDMLSYVNAADTQRYDANTLKMLKTIRQEFLSTDTLKLLIILIVNFALVSAFVLKKIRKELFIAALLVLIIIEMVPVTNLAYSKIRINDREVLEKSVFKDTKITNVLKTKDKSDRLLTLGRDFTSNQWSYFFPTINGYSAIKLQSIQDVIEHNLYKAKTADKVNWNLINMLNGKYIIADGNINSPYLNLLQVDNKKYLFENKYSLPKAWFVKNIIDYKTDEDLILAMNELDFNPKDNVFIVNSEVEKKTFSGEGEIKLVKLEPNSIELEFSNIAESQFMVLSEIYYEEGWKALVDGNETEIQRVNHLLRGIEVPAGAKKVEFVFHPSTYFTSMTLVWSGNIILLILIGLGLFPTLKGRFSKKED